MKKRIISSIIIVMLTVCLLLTGCTEEKTEVATPDQVATEHKETTSETVETEAETEPTVATEKETEKATESTEPTKAETESDSSNQSNNTTTTTTTNTTANNKTNNTNSSSTTKKPSSNNNSNNKTNNSTNTNSKPSSKPLTVTDDTKVSHAQFNTAENMQRMVSYIISHNQSKGMTYDSTLNTNNSGWLFAYQGCLNTTATRSYNEQLSRTVNGLDEDIDSILALDGFATSYSQMRFNCYAEQQSDGEYNIYFCYG